MLNASLNQLLIVEDDRSTRQALVGELEQHNRIQHISAVSTLTEAHQWLAEHQADILLLDVGLPDGNGLTLIPAYADRKPPMRCLILSAMDDERTIVDGIRLGAAGYLLKRDTGAGISHALFEILDGRPALSPAVAQCIMDRLHTPPASTLSTGTTLSLPPRQLETLQLLARGLTYQEIAERMSISFHTVSAYAQEIYSKLAARSRSEAVFLAREMGLL